MILIFSKSSKNPASLYPSYINLIQAASCYQNDHSSVQGSDVSAAVQLTVPFLWDTALCHLSTGSDVSRHRSAVIFKIPNSQK
jgi:hypothetical protein